jgi:hypothetical protein
MRQRSGKFRLDHRIVIREHKPNPSSRAVHGYTSALGSA